MPKPLCFVLMPFGEKPAGRGATIDFDRVYHELIRPAVEAADLEPIRADEEQAGGVIHKPMFERLLLCEYAVADLTTANANVFYELGVRHAAKERSTVLIFAEGIERLPFDVGLLRGLPYRLGPDGAAANPGKDGRALTRRLVEARSSGRDSPLWQLVENYPEVAHEKTDVFRRQVEYAAGVKRRLAAARKGGTDAVRAVERDIGRFADAEAGVLIDLMLSYRATKAWEEVERVAATMPMPLAETAMVREQLAMALNRVGHGHEAAEILERLIAERGPSSETYGILGRVLKDRWEAAEDGPLARGLLRKAIDAYRRGFEADWRDAYPGVNAVTLMELAEPPMKEEQARLLPVVRYAVERRVAAGQPDYWDHATLLELAVLRDDRAAAEDALADVLPVIREAFEPETTARNLRLIRETRARRGAQTAWIGEIEQALAASAPPMSG
jgi:hypothetical protein